GACISAVRVDCCFGPPEAASEKNLDTAARHFVNGVIAYAMAKDKERIAGNLRGAWEKGDPFFSAIRKTLADCRSHTRWVLSERRAPPLGVNHPALSPPATASPPQQADESRTGSAGPRTDGAAVFLEHLEAFSARLDRIEAGPLEGVSVPELIAFLYR